MLGISTDSQDTTGKVLEEKDTSHLTEEGVRAAIMGFEGEYDQIPPMFSALKVNGKKLYELARDGKEVERKPRRVTIHKIQILEMDLPRVRIEVTCSKGTYIRTLCHDIGQILGSGGCMESLLRTRVERFEIKDSIRLDEVRELKENGRLMEHVIGVDEMFPQLKKIYLKPSAAEAVCHGNGFKHRDILWIHPMTEEIDDGEQVLVYDEERNFIAIYEYKKGQYFFKIVKMFFDGNEK